MATTVAEACVGGKPQPLPLHPSGADGAYQLCSAAVIADESSGDDGAGDSCGLSRDTTIDGRVNVQVRRAGFSRTGVLISYDCIVSSSSCKDDIVPHAS